MKDKDKSRGTNSEGLYELVLQETETTYCLRTQLANLHFILLSVIGLMSPGPGLAVGGTHTSSVSGVRGSLPCICFMYASQNQQVVTVRPLLGTMQQQAHIVQ